MQVEYKCKEDGVYPDGITRDSIIKVEVSTCGLLIDSTEEFDEPMNGVDYIFTVDAEKAVVN